MKLSVAWLIVIASVSGCKPTKLDGGHVNPDGSVTLVYGGDAGTSLSYRDFDHRQGTSMALSLPRGKAAEIKRSISFVDPTAVVWDEERDGEPSQFKYSPTKLVAVKYKSDWQTKDFYVDFLTFTYPDHPVKPGESWIVHNNTKNVDLTVTLKSVTELKGRKVANVEITGKNNFAGTSFSSNLEGSKSKPIAAAIDITTGLVIQAKGEILQRKKDTGEPWNYVYDREFSG